VAKTVENERIKLLATYYNNVAVGLVVAGAFIPFFAFMQKSTEVSAWLDAIFHGAPNPTNLNVASVVGPVAICFIALGIAKGFRDHAYEVIGRLKE
jgi:hypothetical protein